uniref:Reverse transcriptase domain, reverse transcriptase zinc-binding domain protein n=1 Tax=Tanacetum cinerariifolium TaxID=118510 RepID=A0A699L6U1_TANCI|nr:reverse transcriptase domain, reverse transcriptase zinc-binding domain protein [Tanacetum cinerariifolium]
MFSNRDIARSGFSLEDSVPSLLDDIDDFILLRDMDGVLRPFSVACAWDTIRTRADIHKLKTQDRLRQWDVGPSIDLNLIRCPLCDLVHDSHDRLFFKCAFSSLVWSKFRVLCGMDSIPPRLIDVSTFINLISKGKTAVSILSRLMLAATSYYIWLERNGRLFKKKTSSPDQIVDVIIFMVRLKLVTFKFKKMTTWSRLLLDQWKIPSSCIVHDGSFRLTWIVSAPVVLLLVWLLMSDEDGGLTVSCFRTVRVSAGWEATDTDETVGFGNVFDADDSLITRTDAGHQDILDKGDSEERSQRITWKVVIVNIHIKNLKKEDSDMLQAACQWLIVE